MWCCCCCCAHKTTVYTKEIYSFRKNDLFLDLDKRRCQNVYASEPSPLLCVHFDDIKIFTMNTALIDFDSLLNIITIFSISFSFVMAWYMALSPLYGMEYGCVTLFRMQYAYCLYSIRPQAQLYYIWIKFSSHRWCLFYCVRRLNIRTLQPFLFDLDARIYFDVQMEKCIDVFASLYLDSMHSILPNFNNYSNVKR